MTSYMRDSDRFDSSLPSIHGRSTGVAEYASSGRGFSRYERSGSPTGDVEHLRVRRRSPSPVSRHVRLSEYDHTRPTTAKVERRSLSPSGNVEHVRRRSVSPASRHVRISAYDNAPPRYEQRSLSPSGDVEHIHRRRRSRSISPAARHVGISNYDHGVTRVQRSLSPSGNVEHIHVRRRSVSPQSRHVTISTIDNGAVQRVNTITTRTEDIYSQDRLAASTAAKSELAALNVRIDTLSSKNLELQAQLHIRDDKIRELQLFADTARESEAKHLAMTDSLRMQASSAERSETNVLSLQRQTRDQLDRIADLEARLRSLNEDRDRVHLDTAVHEKRFTDLVGSLSSILAVDSAFTTSTDGIISRVTDLAQDNASLRGKLDAMREYLSNAELETKASRETITRLVADAEREQRTVSKYTLEMDDVRLDRENSLIKQKEMEREVELLRERLDASQRAWNATRAELEEREGRFAHSESKLREFELSHRTVDHSFRAFKEQVATVLSDSYVTVQPYEDEIREKLSALVRSSTDRKAHIDMLENKISGLTEQLSAQLDLQRGADRRSQKIQGDMFSMEENLRRAEGELAAGDMLRDGLRFDKERYLRFLQEICSALKMDDIAADIGMDGAADAILARIDQVISREGDMLVDRKTHIYNLQRKIKTLKEQMDSKDLHMDLLRKKVASLEERACGRSQVEREKDEEFVKNRKLLKLVDKYKRELNETRMELRDLKARLLESADIRTRTIQQENDLENLESKVGQLEHVRQKQAHKIQGLKCELDDTVSKFGEKKNIAHHTVATLTSELKALKMALQEMTNRERQLLDLRQVIARMLGLDVNSLAVPDYEIISRLEKLILANQSNAATVVALDTAMSDVSDGFRVGYENASRSMHRATRSRSPMKVSRSMGASMGRKSRARSMSPSRRRDTRQY